MVKTKSSRIPKYVSIQDDLRKKIADGIYPPGTRLPPDSELHQHYNVNRLTMIRALEDLSREGLIIRQHGSGTYVADFREKPFIPGKCVKIGIIFSETVNPDFSSFSRHQCISKDVEKLLEEMLYTPPQRVKTILDLPGSRGKR